MQLAYIVIDKKGKVKSPRRRGYHRHYDLPRSIQSVPPPVHCLIDDPSPSYCFVQ